MPTATLLPLPRAVFYDGNGDPLVGGWVYTYVPNTTTFKTTWEDAAETIPNANPVPLDSGGSCLLYGSGQYDLVVTDSLNNQVPAYSGLTEDIISQTQISAAMQPVVSAATVQTGFNLITGGILNATLPLTSTHPYTPTTGNQIGTLTMAVGGVDPTEDPLLPGTAGAQMIAVGGDFNDPGATGSTQISLISSIAYTRGTRSVVPVWGEGQALASGANVWGMAGSAWAKVSGTSAAGAQFDALSSSSGTNAIALILGAGGTGSNPISAYMQIVSNAVGNSAATGVLINDSTINPLNPVGTLMQTSGGGLLTCKVGFDFHNATFTQAFLLSPGFSVDGTGLVTATELITTLGLVNVGAPFSNGRLQISYTGAAAAQSGINITDSQAASGSQFASFFTGASLIGSITNSSNTAVLYNTTSDATLKRVIGKLNARKAIDNIDAVEFTWNETGKRDVGFLAQDVAPFAPGAVTPGDEKRPWQLDKSALVPYLWADNKSLRAEIDKLRAEVNKSRDRLDAMEAMLTLPIEHKDQMT